jgi:hypothetical protein
MTEYKIDFGYVEPRIGEVELTAKDETEAREYALDAIQASYPEAEDVEIIEVNELNG